MLRYLPGWGCGRCRNLVLIFIAVLYQIWDRTWGLIKYQSCPVALCDRDFVLRVILQFCCSGMAASAPDGLVVKRCLMEHVGHTDAPLKTIWAQPIAQLFIDGESDIVKSQAGREGAREVWSKILCVAASKMEKGFEPSEIAYAKELRSILIVSPLYSSEAIETEFWLKPDDFSMLYSILALLIARVSIPSFGAER